jgi:hypothetical protein
MILQWTSAVLLSLRSILRSYSGCRTQISGLCLSRATVIEESWIVSGMEDGSLLLVFESLPA